METFAFNECHKQIVLAKDDFRRPPDYHMDVWQAILDQLGLPSDATDIAVWISTVDVY